MALTPFGAALVGYSVNSVTILGFGLEVNIVPSSDDDDDQSFEWANADLGPVHQENDDGTMSISAK